MNLGYALLIICVIVLIERHHLWKLTAKIGGVLLLLVGILYGSMWLWDVYQAHKERVAPHTVQFDPTLPYSDLPPGATVTHIVPPPGYVLEQPGQQEGLRPGETETPIDYDALAKQAGAISSTPAPPVGRSKKKTPKPEPPIYAKAKSVTRIYNRSYFELADTESARSPIAWLNKGDRVQVLSEAVRAACGADIYKVRFRQWTGWIEATDLVIDLSDLEVVGPPVK
ncbi:MAG: hypothetical protein ABSA41_17105 [Terriglobia bacterium]|jgi:hypothetical protein